MLHFRSSVGGRKIKAGHVMSCHRRLQRPRPRQIHLHIACVRACMPAIRAFSTPVILPSVASAVEMHPTCR